MNKPWLLNRWSGAVRWLMVVLWLGVAVGCSTTRGVGKDIEDAGSGIKHAAERQGAE